MDCHGSWCIPMSFIVSARGRAREKFGGAESEFDNQGIGSMNRSGVKDRWQMAVILYSGYSRCY